MVEEQKIDFSKIEKKWQDKWEKEKVFEVTEDKNKKKFYVLEMFPYPSATGLHMGHAWNFILGDIFSRFKQAQGFNVLHPMGFDSLGLPAENAAIKAGTHPEDYTNNSIKNFKKQQKMLGLGYDWAREVNTASAEYYGWDQWIFLKMFEKGLVYEKEAPVNWCNSCNTIISNEQAQGGTCERCGTKIEIKQMKQWFLKITDYAEQLLEGHEKLNWPEKTIAMQKNWIGKSHGTEIDFEVENPDWKNKSSDINILSAKISDAEEIRFIVASGWRENNISPENGVTIELLEKEKGYTLPPKKEAIEKTKKYIKENPENNYIAKINGKVVGWIGLTFHKGKKISYGVYVHSEYQGKGIGKSLINFVHNKYSDYQFFIEVTSTNKRAIKLYEELGYAKKSEDKYKIGKAFLPLDIMYRENLVQPTNKKWPIFTTRPDTIYGVTFVVVSAQHHKLNELVTKEQKKEVEKFLKKLRSVSEKELGDMEKEGVFTGSYAINPVNGDKVPVYAGNFVVADYGSGMVMAVPAHDQRDFEFAKKYGIAIKQVITGKDPLDFKNRFTGEKAFTQAGLLMNSKQFSGSDSNAAKEQISEWLISQGKARKVVNYKLRDWSVARQRYWGTPIPLIHCEKCGVVPVPENDLPVKLPKDVKFGKGNPLLTNEKWLNVKCPKCGGKAKREPNTMDTFVNSSWYFLRYCDPQNNKEIFDKRKAKYWMPVDLYIGGPEHACMHLIYSRFYTRFLHDLGLIDFEEPAPRLLHQGMINGSDGEKMSKSKGNGVEPLETIEKYGTDTLRFFMVSMAAPDKGFNWSEEGIQSALKFLRKIFFTFEEIKFGKDSQEMAVKVNKSVKNVTEQIENLDYRKSTIELRELFEMISEQKEISKESFAKSIKLLAPFCPHIAEELWEKLGNKDFISKSEWPKYEEVKEKKSQENLNEKVVEMTKEILHKYSDKKVSKVYIYAMPFEVGKFDQKIIEKSVGKTVEILAVNDPKKYDPENRAKKSLPGKPSIYLE